MDTDSGAVLSVFICVHLWLCFSAQREKGKSPACALRYLGQRWLKILWKLWQSRAAYDETVHALNQQKQGFWVLPLKAKTT